MNILARLHRFIQRHEAKPDRAIRFHCAGCRRLYVGPGFNIDGKILCSPLCEGVMRIVREVGCP